MRRRIFQLRMIHCVENAALEPLEIIEIQVGSYLGEDDIVLDFEDRCGRQDVVYSFSGNANLELKERGFTCLPWKTKQI